MQKLEHNGLYFKAVRFWFIGKGSDP